MRPYELAPSTTRWKNADLYTWCKILNRCPRKYQLLSLDVCFKESDFFANKKWVFWMGISEILSFLLHFVANNQYAMSFDPKCMKRCHQTLESNVPGMKFTNSGLNYRNGCVITLGIDSSLVEFWECLLWEIRIQGFFLNDVWQLCYRHMWTIEDFPNALAKGFCPKKLCDGIMNKDINKWIQ